MHNFTTDWKKIGQSGPTIDGRNIDPQMLLDAADTYNLETYTAVIWVDHMRWYGNYGKVVELKAEEAGGIVSLYAKLQPNEFLVSQNGAGQKLFTSMELCPNFADTGKCYLEGLAVTDSPASLGTHELRFNSRRKAGENIILCGVELGELSPAPTSDEEVPGWFKNLFSRHFGGGDAPISEQPKNEDTPMNEEQFNAITGGLETLGKAVAGLEEKFAAVPPADDPAPANAPKEGKQLTAEEMTQALALQVTDLGKDMEKKFTELSSRMAGEKPGTPAGETITPAADAQGKV